MLKQVGMAAMLLFAVSATQSAFAGADCKEYPKDKQMSELDMQKKVVNEYGFVIDKFKKDDNCYEVYGRAPKSVAMKAGAKEGDAAATAPAPADDKVVKIEVYFDMADGSIVKKEVD